MATAVYYHLLEPLQQHVPLSDDDTAIVNVCWAFWAGCHAHTRALDKAMSDRDVVAFAQRALDAFSTRLRPQLRGGGGGGTPDPLDAAIPAVQSLLRKVFDKASSSLTAECAAAPPIVVPPVSVKLKAAAPPEPSVAAPPLPHPCAMFPCGKPHSWTSCLKRLQAIRTLTTAEMQLSPEVTLWLCHLYKVHYKNVGCAPALPPHAVRDGKGGVCIRLHDGTMHKLVVTKLVSDVQQ